MEDQRNLNLHQLREISSAGGFLGHISHINISIEIHLDCIDIFDIKLTLLVNILLHVENVKT